MKLIVLAVILMGATVVTVWAVQTQVWTNPVIWQVGDIKITRYLDGVEWGNDTIDYGIIYPDNTYSYNWTIRNDVDTTIIVTYTAVNLPENYTLTWTANNTTLGYLESAVGWLDLYVPLSAMIGTDTCEGHTKAEYT